MSRIYENKMQMSSIDSKRFMRTIIIIIAILKVQEFICVFPQRLSYLNF